jgi:hypothetical protein
VLVTAAQADDSAAETQLSLAAGADASAGGDQGVEVVGEAISRRRLIHLSAATYSCQLGAHGDAAARYRNAIA